MVPSPLSLPGRGAMSRNGHSGQERSRCPETVTSATVAIPRAADIPYKGDNYHGKQSMRQNHPHRRPPHGQAAHRPLYRIPAQAGGAAEFRRVQEDLHHDRGRPGPHGQYREPGEGAPEHHRGGAGLYRLRP